MTNTDNNLRIKIGLKIRIERTKRKLSQEKLSELSDISKTYIGSIERGESVPTIDILNKIAIAFEMELKELVDVSKVDL